MHDKKNGICTTAYGLKLAAILTMLVDHTATALLLWFRRLSQGRTIYETMRGIGRMAFPLFCFLLVEGFFHTRSRWRYLGGLVAFAVISELPSDLFFRSWERRGDALSIFATLSLGLLCMILSDRLAQWCGGKKNGKPVAVLGCGALAAAAVLLGEALHVEYDGEGVALILMIFYAEKLAPSARVTDTRRWKNAMAVLAIAAWLIAYDVRVSHGLNETYGLVAAIPLALYGGERGSYRLPKWFFYVFYPAHLLVLIGIRAWIAR